MMTDQDPSDCNTLRASNAHLGPQSNVVDIDFHGRKIKARRGESLLAALVASGELHLRVTQEGQPRGPFCGMGVCQECLVEVDGAPAERACMTKVERPITVRRQENRVGIASGTPGPPEQPPAPAATVLAPQIAVIGGGPGGMAAATCAARAGADVLLIDERPQLGGQFYKQPVTAKDLPLADFDDQQFSRGRQLIHDLEQSGVHVLHSASVVAAYEPLDLVVSLPAGIRLIRPQILIVATGAYEVSYPFKGWTLPGVMTTGAAQTLLRSYRVLPGRRVLIAGNGPLNFQVAAELAKSGAEVVAVVEAAGKPAFSHLPELMRMLANAPDLAAKGAGHLASLRRHGTAMVYGQKVLQVDALGNGATSGLKATTQHLSHSEMSSREFEVDAVCLGYGFRPSNEILRALGCKQQVIAKSGTLDTVRDENCRTSRNDVLAVGDCTRLGGAPIAEAEGAIAASTALGMLGVSQPDDLTTKMVRERANRTRHGKFQKALWRLFEPAGQLFGSVADDSIVCRCEELTLAALQQAMDSAGPLSMASLKRATRAGMGRCQGRYCAPTIAQMVAAQRGIPIEEADLWAPRPPAKPIQIANLAQLTLPSDS